MNIDDLNDTATKKKGRGNDGDFIKSNRVKIVFLLLAVAAVVGYIFL